jgi:ATP-dependent RNA helicase DHX8/PRP22
MLILSVDGVLRGDPYDYLHAFSRKPVLSSRDKQAQADMKARSFTKRSHLTLLAVYKAWEASKFSNQVL